MYRRLPSSSTSSISLLLLLLPLSTVQSTDSYRTQLFPQLASIQQSDPSETMETRDPEALTIPSKCQRDYLEAMMHRCRHGDRVCFADGQSAAFQATNCTNFPFTDLELENVRELTIYISEMCCLLHCQPKTLERICCRSQQGKCRKVGGKHH